jgi:hypothetical protein
MEDFTFLSIGARFKKYGCCSLAFQNAKAILFMVRILFFNFF